MKRRFTMNRDGELVDRHGVVLPLDSRELRDDNGVVVALIEGITISDAPLGGGGVGRFSFVLTTTSRDEHQQSLARDRAKKTASAIETVWAHYVSVMKPRRKELDPETRKLLRAALQVGTADEWCLAVDGCKASAFHMGANDRRKRYNKPSHIFKGKRGTRTTREQLDMFLEIAERTGAGGALPSADAARVRQAKRDVLDAHSFPGDEQVVRRGEESANWLAQHGWVIDRSESSRPRFHLRESGE